MVMTLYLLQEVKGVLSGRESGTLFLLFLLPTKFISKSVDRPVLIIGAGIVLWEVYDYIMKEVDKLQKPSRYSDWLAEKKQESDDSLFEKFKDVFEEYPLDPSYLIVEDHPEIKF